LQNFLHFNSWETYRMVSQTVSGNSPFSTSVQVTTTTQYLTFNLRWPTRRTQLRLSVHPPGEAQPTVMVGQGNILMRFDVPTSSAYDYLGDWQVKVELVEPTTHVGEPLPPVPFELVILGEDATLHSEMNIVPRDYVPGDQIELEARLVEFGRPLVDLGSQPGATLIAQVVKPGVSIGDLLSSSTASTTPPNPQDASTPAEARLINELQANPNALVRDSSDAITLVDSGDGVYRGKYGVQTPGHYNFLFGLQGQTRNTGGFSRMQLKTVYVRPAPDASQTGVTSAIRDNQLVITVTPRTRFGNNLGLGWGNYFWFKSPGRPATKGRDNLDGSYTVALPTSGLFPPPVTLHFLNISMVIGDTVTEDQLPIPLDDNSTLIPNVGRPGLSMGWPWWLILLLVLLLLIYLIWRILNP
ncbi:MAG: hypothetical protein WCD37_18035, partial [Chloroflexia bacterium]